MSKVGQVALARRSFRRVFGMLVERRTMIVRDRRPIMIFKKRFVRRIERFKA